MYVQSQCGNPGEPGFTVTKNLSVWHSDLGNFDQGCAPPASVETSNRTGSMSEETSLSGSPEWIPRTRVHCMVKEETFGRMAHPTPSWTTQQLGSLESALVAFENRHIRSESLGGGCEAVQELVREIPAICGSYPVCVRSQQTTSLCVLDSHHPCLPYLWSSNGPKHLQTPAAHRLF